MFRPAITLMLPVLLMTSLLGCAKDSKPAVALTNKSVAARCPTETSTANQQKILDYLDRAPKDSGLDTLSTEWFRLNDGSSICRTGVATK